MDALLTIGLAKEVADGEFGINARCVRVPSARTCASGEKPARVRSGGKQFVALLKRGGTAGKWPKLHIVLLSRDASFTTGSFIDVTGGN